MHKVDKEIIRRSNRFWETLFSLLNGNKNNEYINYTDGRELPCIERH